MSDTGQQETYSEIDTIEEFQDDSGIPPSIQGRIYAFLQRAELEESNPVFYLFKYENYVSGEGKAFLQKFEDCEPPDEQTIARIYGSGRYLLTLNIPQRGKQKCMTRTYRFRVHPAFDKSNSITTPATMPPQYYMQPPGNGHNGMMEAFSMLEKLMVMLVPLFNRPRDENVLDILNQNYSAVNQVMKKQMQDNVSLLTDYQRQIADIGETGMVPETQVEPEADTPSILEQFAPIIQQFIPLILGGGPQAQAASAVVKTVPQVQQIIRDKVELRRVIQYLDNTQGEAATDQILSALKVRRPSGSARGRPAAAQPPQQRQQQPQRRQPQPKKKVARKKPE